MKTYNPSKWSQKVVVAGLTVVIAASALELVAVAMKFPDLAAMAVREQVIAAQSERVYQLRTLQQGEFKIAAIKPANGI
jgi:hypothetical protein